MIPVIIKRREDCRVKGERTLFQASQWTPIKKSLTKGQKMQICFKKKELLVMVVRDFDDKNGIGD